MTTHPGHHVAQRQVLAAGIGPIIARTAQVLFQTGLFKRSLWNLRGQRFGQTAEQFRLATILGQRDAVSLARGAFQAIANRIAAAEQCLHEDERGNEQRDKGKQGDDICQHSQRISVKC